MNTNIPVAVRPSAPTPLARDGEWALALPFERASDVPSLNDREHWAVKAKRVKLWRDAAHLLARQSRIPACRRIRVELHYVPATSRRRDPDNLVAAYKPLVDGLVDAGVVLDDTEAYVERVFPVIHTPMAQLPSRSFRRFVLRVVAL